MDFDTPAEKRIMLYIATTVALLLVIYLGVWVRLSTINTPTVLDYDPWWFYRYARMILDNGLKPPEWDIQSYYPPGRPVNPFEGWPYTIIFFYKILNIFTTATFMKAAILSPLIMVALIPIPAFLLGRLLTNNLGGLVTALFAVLTPSFIGVSMAGYCDTDAPVVFYFFLSVFTTLLAVKKPKPIYIIFAVIANLLFIWNWGGGWITLILFTVFIFVLPLFRALESFIHNLSFKLDIKEIARETIKVGQPIFIIILLTNLIYFFIFNSTEFHSFFGGLAFTGLAAVIRWGVLLILILWNGIFAYYFIRSISRRKNMYKRIYFSLLFLGSLYIFYLIFFAFLTTTTHPLLVNISVAELQPVNILSYSGFMSVASRVGLLSTILAFGLFFLALYKIWKKEKISPEEVFFFLWLLTMFALISRGVRFSLQFSVAAAVAGGYVIAHYKKYPLILFLILVFSLLVSRQYFVRTIYDTIGIVIILGIAFFALFKKESELTNLFILGFFVFQLLFFISNAIQIGQTPGMEISQNWYNALNWLSDPSNSDKDTLIVTWWDPGHILAGYSYYKGNPLKVHADGAHCGPGDCVPYNHNIRIQDMGRIFATNSEEEAIGVLKKYTYLTPEECQEVKKDFGDRIYDNILKEDPCTNVTKVYIIASNDLIGKYYWLSYFGTGTGRNFIQLQLSSRSGDKLVYGGGLVTLAMKDNKLVPILNFPQQGISNAIIKEIIFYQNGQPYSYDYSNATNKIDGLLWVDPSFQVVIFMDPAVRDSVFTNMFFFNGEGFPQFGIQPLKHFHLVYSNPEVKIFNVTFSTVGNQTSSI